MTIGFTYVVVEENSGDFLKVGRGTARSHDKLAVNARQRLGKLQSCNVRTLRFARLFEFASPETAKSAEADWHTRWRSRAGLGSYEGQEWYRWSGPAGHSVSPEMIEEFMHFRTGFVAVHPEANAYTAPGGYLGYADAERKSDGSLRQMRLHILHLVDHEQHFWHLYGTSAPHELSKEPEASIAKWWYTGNPRQITKPYVLERNSFDPAASQAELSHAISSLRERFNGGFVPAALPSRGQRFALSWIRGDEGEIVGAALEALGPVWQRHTTSAPWPGQEAPWMTR